MSLYPSTVLQLPGLLDYQSEALFDLRAGDPRRISLSDDGASGEQAKITARSGHVGYFARTSAGYYVTRGGLLAPTFANRPRMSHVDVDGDGVFGSRGLRLEGARTNLLLRSEEFDNASWIKTDTTIAANAIAGPTGAVLADRCTEGTAGTAVVTQDITVTAGATTSFSCFFKYGSETSWVRMLMQDTTSAHFVNFWINILTQTAGTSTATGSATLTRAYIKKLADGWTRATIVGAIAGATTYRCRTNSADADGSGARVNNASRYQWGAHAREAGVAGSYVPTTTAAATHNADSCYFDFKAPPQGMTGYWRLLNRGTAQGANDTRIFHLGLTNASTDPRLVVDVQSNFARILHDNGTAEVTSTLAAIPLVGELWEIRAELFGSDDSAPGAVRIHQSIEEAAETSGTKSAANALGATWGGAASARLYVNSDPAGGNLGFADVLAGGFMPGTGYTMAQLRSRFA